VHTGPAHRSSSSLLPCHADVPSVLLPCHSGERSGAPCEHPSDARRRDPRPRRLPLFLCMVMPSSSLPFFSSPFGIASPSLTSRLTFPCRSSTPLAARAIPHCHPLRHRRGHHYQHHMMSSHLPMLQNGSATPHPCSWWPQLIASPPVELERSGRSIGATTARAQSGPWQTRLPRPLGQAKAQ
jgi:hypothetical protein